MQDNKSDKIGWLIKIELEEVDSMCLFKIDSIRKVDKNDSPEVNKRPKLNNSEET